jgi:nitroimidazol reductase NimA-like FMN-containing flavoprotein (pyridoxamine 5'-phosphate oxidase superfamily)
MQDKAGGDLMDDLLNHKILSLLDAHRIMTIATLRPDGWPQATTVGYVNEGLVLWFLCGLDSQKAKNLAHDNRVSITIDHDTPDIMSITGLSMAARAYRVSDRAEAAKVIGLLPLKYPDAPPSTAQMKLPAPEEVAIFRVAPEIISVLDYTKGFGHTDIVTC